MASTSRSPTRRSVAGGKRDVSPQQLQERVRELEGAEREAKKNQLKEQKQRQKELAEAKKKVTKELQTASRLVQRGEREAGKLATKVDQVEKLAEQSKSKQSRQVAMIEDSLGRMRTKRNGLEATLQDKVSAVGEARGRLAHATFAAKMLEAGVIVPIEGTFELSQVGGALGDASVDFSGEHDDQAHRIAELEEDNRMLRDRVAELEALLVERRDLDSYAFAETDGQAEGAVATSKGQDMYLANPPAPTGFKAAPANKGDGSASLPSSTSASSGVVPPSPFPLPMQFAAASATSVEAVDLGQQARLSLSMSHQVLPRRDGSGVITGGSMQLPPAHLAIPSAGMLATVQGPTRLISSAPGSAFLPAGPSLWAHPVHSAAAPAGAAVVPAPHRSVALPMTHAVALPMEPVAGALPTEPLAPTLASGFGMVGPPVMGYAGSASLVMGAPPTLLVNGCLLAKPVPTA